MIRRILLIETGNTREEFEIDELSDGFHVFKWLTSPRDSRQTKRIGQAMTPGSAVTLAKRSVREPVINIQVLSLIHI